MRSLRHVWITSLAVGAAVMLGAAPSASAQATGAVRGSVTDSATQQPVENAQVFVVGTGRGALTNRGGQFVITNVPAGTQTVRVRSIGFMPEDRGITVAAGDTATVSFVLRPSPVELGEVVVVGYGTRSRREVSSSVSNVTGEQIQNTPVAGLDAALQGKAAGIQVTQNAGNPGNGITVRIRGSASLSASNQPLYVIDGVPMLREDFSQLGLGGQDVTAVTGINPDEIESIDILKDAAAAAIYGSRGSNGVVLITTKRGRAGPARISFNAYTGVQRVTKRVDMLNAQEYIAYMNEGATNDGYDPDEVGTPGVDDLINTNWQDQVFRTAPVSDISLSASGGTDRVRYLLSGSYFDQEGIVIGSAYNRASARVNLDFNATDRVAFRASASLLREDTDRIENDNTINGVVTNAIAVQPNLPVRLEDGRFTSTDDGLEYSNPVALGTLNSAESRTVRALGNVEALFDLSSGLRLTSRVGMDVLNLRDLLWESPQIIGTYAASAAGVAEYGNTTATRFLLESFLNYDRVTGGAHALSLTGGASVEFNDVEDDFLRGEGFGNEDFRYVGNAAKVTEYDGGTTGHNLVSFFSRANYSLNDRYFFTASLRADGSSRFGENNRYGVFPAASIGWVMSDEPFMTALNRLGELKLRASYGFTGNQGIDDDFAFLPRFGKANYADEPGIAPVSLSNPDLKWETTKEFDVGFDLSLRGGRLMIIGDYYVKTTSDLLVERPITSTSGLTDVWENVGNIENKGFELEISSVNIEAPSRDGFRWTTDLNFSTNRNKVTRLFRGEPFNTGIDGINRVQEGEPLGAFFSLHFEGVDPETGEAIFTDLNGDGDINADDRMITGSPHPDFWGGLGNTFSWKGFDLRAFVQFTQGFEIYNAMGAFSDDAGFFFDNKFKRVLNRWQQPGDITDQPRASFDGVSGGLEISDRWVEDGSYIRLQELTLGYSLPERFAQRLNLNSARLYVSGRNLHTWTDFIGYSPDVNSNGSGTNTSLGTDFYAYPLARTINIGITGAW